MYNNYFFKHNFNAWERRDKMAKNKEKKKGKKKEGFNFELGAPLGVETDKDKANKNK